MLSLSHPLTSRKRVFVHKAEAGRGLSYFGLTAPLTQQNIAIARTNPESVPGLNLDHQERREIMELLVFCSDPSIHGYKPVASCICSGSYSVLLYGSTLALQRISSLQIG